MSLIISELERNDTRLPVLVKSMSEIVNTYFAGDFRFVEFSVALINEILTCCDESGEQYAEKLVLSLIFKFDETDVPLTMKTSIESIEDCIAVVRKVCNLYRVSRAC